MLLMQEMYKRNVDGDKSRLVESYLSNQKLLLDDKVKT